MTTMISNLPRDLMEEIIYRIPLNSMKAVRLTCKSWNNLLKSESLRKMHTLKATKTRECETMMIAATRHNLYLMSLVVEDDVDPSIELKGKLSFLDNQVNISQIYHYEGLVLCVLKDGHRIVVWNPYWGQTRWIDLRTYLLPKGYYDYKTLSYALGYEDKKSCRSLKFSMFLYFINGSKTQCFLWCYIYNFDSGLWRNFDVKPHCNIRWYCDSVSLKGNTYWCACECDSKDGVIHHIICFDFTRERFGPLLPLPSPTRHHENDYKIVTLSCVQEEKLAALFQHSKSNLYKPEIWITTKVSPENVSWSKFLKLDLGPVVSVPDHFFIYEEKKLFIGLNKYHRNLFININGKAEYFKQMSMGGPEDVKSLPYMCSYVPSLVQIKKLARRKKKRQKSLEMQRQNSLEKRWFKQNQVETCCHVICDVVVAVGCLFFVLLCFCAIMVFEANYGLL